MPYSSGENAQDVLWWATVHRIDSVLDIGTGAGFYGRLLYHNTSVMHGVEIWPPYIQQFKLGEIYDRVLVEDVRSLPGAPSIDTYDLAIFGDVLEHMNREEAMEAWDWAASIAKYGLISVPIGHHPQGAEYGNPYEVHRQEHLTVDAVEQDYGPFGYRFVYKETATFIKELSI